MTSYSWTINLVETFKKYPWVQIQTLLRSDVHDSCLFGQKWTNKMANHFLQGNPNDQNAHLFWQIPFLCVPHQISLIKLQINFKVSFLCYTNFSFQFQPIFSFSFMPCVDSKLLSNAKLEGPMCTFVVTHYASNAISCQNNFTASISVKSWEISLKWAIAKTVRDGSHTTIALSDMNWVKI